MAFARIHLDFASLFRPPPIGYFKYNNPPPKIKEYMDALNAPIRQRNAAKEAAAGRKLAANEKEHEWTTCAIQASHAFNSTRFRCPAFSHRRPNYAIPGGNGHYIHAVDEMEDWLTKSFNPTDDLVRLRNASKSGDLTAPIKGKNGIITFADKHVEFWRGNDIVRNGGDGARMSPTYIWGQPKILFWEIGLDTPSNATLPDWLQGWWHVYDGNHYYYYFNELPTVVYTKKAPPNGSAPPPSNPANGGRVDLLPHGAKVTWRPTGGATTVEEFTRLGWTSETDMNGVSNRFAPLYARKIP